MKKTAAPGRTRLRWQFQHPLPKPAKKLAKSDLNPDDCRDTKNPDKVSSSQ